MDEDLRSRYRAPRRDFSAPQPRPEPRPNAMPPRPSHPAAEQAASHPAANPYHSALAQPMFPAATPHQPAHAVHYRPAHHHPKAKKRSLKKWLIVPLLLVLLGSGAAGAYYFKFKKAASPLPASITSQVNYPIYYPKPVPVDYTYKPGSATVQSGLFIYRLSSGSKTIIFTEQSLPKTKIDLGALKQFSLLDASVGQVAISTNVNLPAAIVVTSTTLVNLSGNSGVSQSDIKAAVISLIATNNQ